MELDIIKNSTTWNDAAGSINNNFEKLRLSVEEGGGSSVTVDTEVSDTSTNPIANKSIKKYVDDEMVRMEGYAEDVANDAEAAAKQYADDNKVAKVDGKQLSTEDFTTTLKQKLEGLTNYDDAEVKSAIEALESNLDAILNGNASGAIENINEILAFLSTIADTDTLAGIVANLQGLIAANTTKIEALEESVDAELAKRPEPLIIEVGIDFPSETATGTIADFAVSYETVKAAMESGSNIEMVEANGNRHSCTFFCDNGEDGIIIRATTHTTNESHIRMLVFARGSSVVVWRSNYHILQEQLVSGVNIKTVNGESLLGEGDIPIGGGGISEETEVYIGEVAPTDEGAKLWIDPTGTPSGGGSSSGDSSGVGAEYIVLDFTNPQSIIDAYTKVKAASEGTADAPSLYLLGENMLHPVLECSIENGFEINVIMDGKLAKAQFDVTTGDVVGVELDEYNFLVASTDDAIKAQNLKVVARAGYTSLPTYRKFISNSEGSYYDYYQILALVKDTTITEEGQRIYLFTIMDNDLGLLTLYIYDDGSIRTI